MSSADVVPAPSSLPVSGQLLFYTNPEPLNVVRHGNLKIKKDDDFAFARVTNSVAITSTEFTAAMRFYPIVFAAHGPEPRVVLGLEGDNLFVDKNGHWQAGHYVPAYIRRYPFVFINNPDGKQFALGIDRAAALLGEDGDGRVLFEGGKPSEVTEQALAFCGAYQTDYGFTASFGQALEEQKLLVDNQAQAKFPNGRQLSLSGFRVVDRERFANLSDAVIVEWHRHGWLALVHYHLASLERFTALLEVTNQALVLGEG